MTRLLTEALEKAYEACVEGPIPERLLVVHEGEEYELRFDREENLTSVKRLGFPDGR